MTLVVVFGLLLLFSSAWSRDEYSKNESAILEKADYLVFISRITRASNGATQQTCLSGFLIKHGEVFYVVTAGHLQPLTKKIIFLEVMIRGTENQRVPRRRYRAKVIGIDRATDVGLLRITDPDFRYDGRLPEFTGVNSLRVGDAVYSLGHPHGHMWQMSRGEVLSTNRRYGGRDPIYKDFHGNLISHTSWTASGSSGGPLLNSRGEIAGMNILRVHSDRPPTSAAVSTSAIKRGFDAILNKKPS